MERATVYTAEIEGVDLALEMVEVIAKADNRRKIREFDIFTDN
jgi:hypothetical protein